MRHYRSETFRPPIGLTKSGHPALSPGRGEAPPQRSRQPGRAVRRPIQLSSTPPTPPLSHAPRRSRGAGLVRDVGDAGVSFPARLCAAGAPTPDAPSRTGSRCAGRCAAWGMGSFCECRWDGAARVVGAQIKRAPMFEGASSTLGVGSVGSYSLGTLCTRECCEPSSEA